jgi:hypothetical protein
MKNAHHDHFRTQRIVVGTQILNHASCGGKLGIGIKEVDHWVAFWGRGRARRTHRQVDVKFTVCFQDGGLEAVGLTEDRLVAWLRCTAEAAENTRKEQDKTVHVAAFLTAWWLQAEKVERIPRFAEPPLIAELPYPPKKDRVCCRTLLVLSLPARSIFTEPTGGQLARKKPLRTLRLVCLAGQRYAYHAFGSLFKKLFEIVRHRTKQHGLMCRCLPFRVDPTQAIVVE